VNFTKEKYMSIQSRREFMSMIAKGIGGVCLLPIPALAGGPCDIKHPFMPPDKDFAGQCPNCGMVIIFTGVTSDKIKA
jgi:hypothetical protein